MTPGKAYEAILITKNKELYLADEGCLNNSEVPLAIFDYEYKYFKKQ